MDEQVAEVAFLASAENRVRALEELVARPVDRYELQDALGISRATASRILAAFETRGWVTQTEHQTYRLTPLGDVVASEFTGFLDTVERMQRLSAVTPWLPEAFDLDPIHLSDAEITIPTPTDSVAPVRRATEIMREAEKVQGVAMGIATEALRANRDLVVEEGQSFEVVFSTAIFDVIEHSPEMARLLVELLDAGGRVYEHEDVPYHYGLFDDTRVGIGVIDNTGAPRAYLETTAEPVIEWADSTFESYRSEATPVDPERYRDVEHH